MSDLKKEQRIKSAVREIKEETVLRATVLVGSGTPESPYRLIEEYWTKNGVLLMQVEKVT